MVELFPLFFTRSPHVSRMQKHTFQFLNPVDPTGFQQLCRFFGGVFNGQLRIPEAALPKLSARRIPSPQLKADGDHSNLPLLAYRQRSQPIFKVCSVYPAAHASFIGRAAGRSTERQKTVQISRWAMNKQSAACLSESLPDCWNDCAAVKVGGQAAPQKVSEPTFFWKML